MIQASECVLLLSLDFADLGLDPSDRADQLYRSLGLTSTDPVANRCSDAYEEHRRRE